jgi:hypothetical protein
MSIFAISKFHNMQKLIFTFYFRSRMADDPKGSQVICIARLVLSGYGFFIL